MDALDHAGLLEAADAVERRGGAEAGEAGELDVGAVGVALELIEEQDVGFVKSLCHLTKEYSASEVHVRARRPARASVEAMNRSALLALTAAGLMFGLTVPLSKLALGWLDPAWLAAVRFGLAAPVLALVARRTLRGGGDAADRRVGRRRATARWSCCRTSASSARASRTRRSSSAPSRCFVAAGSALAGRAVAGPAAWSGFGVALGGVALVAGSGGAASPRRRRARARLGGARLGADRRPGRAARGARPGRGDRRADGRGGPVRARVRPPHLAAGRARRRRRRRSRWARSSASAR